MERQLEDAKQECDKYKNLNNENLIKFNEKEQALLDKFESYSIDMKKHDQNNLEQQDLISA